MINVDAIKSRLYYAIRPKFKKGHLRVDAYKMHAATDMYEKLEVRVQLTEPIFDRRYNINRSYALSPDLMYAHRDSGIDTSEIFIQRICEDVTRELQIKMNEDIASFAPEVEEPTRVEPKPIKEAYNADDLILII